MVATACGAVGHGDTGTRADIVNATAAAARGIGEGWHAAQAAAAQAKLRGLLAAETIAAAASLFRCGLLGRASARGARIAAAMARRWLRLNSRREALTVAEVGGAAGVDDRQAARDWSAELSSIAAAIFAAAAANGSALLALAAAARSGRGAERSRRGAVAARRSARRRWRHWRRFRRWRLAPRYLGAVSARRLRLSFGRRRAVRWRRKVLALSGVARLGWLPPR